MGTGMWAAIGILAALQRRHATGGGGVVDVSLFETATALMSLLAAHYLSSGELPRKLGSATVGIVPYRSYRTADGEDLVIAAGNDALFRKFCEVLGREEWTRDPRFVSNPERVLRLSAWNVVAAPSQKGGPHLRASSPSGLSILMTSAPRSPRIWPA